MHVSASVCAYAYTRRKRLKSAPLLLLLLLLLDKRLLLVRANRKLRRGSIALVWKFGRTLCGGLPVELVAVALAAAGAAVAVGLVAVLFLYIAAQSATHPLILSLMVT